MGLLVSPFLVGVAVGATVGEVGAYVGACVCPTFVGLLVALGGVILMFLLVKAFGSEAHWQRQ